MTQDSDDLTTARARIVELDARLAAVEAENERLRSALIDTRDQLVEYPWGSYRAFSAINHANEVLSPPATQETDT